MPLHAAGVNTNTSVAHDLFTNLIFQEMQHDASTASTLQGSTQSTLFCCTGVTGREKSI